jgi:hypothetical protein
MFPPFAPGYVSLPPPVTLPLFPVLLHLTIGDPLVSGWCPLVVMVRYDHDLTGHASWFNKSPGAVIGRGFEPMTLVGTVPGVPEKEYIDVDIRYRINIGPGYDDHLRRASNSEQWGQSNIHADADVCCTGLAAKKG